jgi:putative membrane protein
VLCDFGVTPADLLGSGGESEVYALDVATVLRIYRSPTAVEYAERRREFYGWLAEQGLRFELPSVLEIGTADGRVYAVERRMGGRVLAELMPCLDGADRARALASYLAAAEAIGGIALADRPFGEILADRPVRRETWAGFLWDRLLASYGVSRADLTVDVPRVGQALEHVRAGLQALEPFGRRRLVHGDYFPGNVYIGDDLRVTGVGDFGYSTVVGDPLLDVAGAVAFLEVVDGHHPEDGALLKRLVRERHGADVDLRLDLYRLWYSFYFSGCKVDDPPTYAWCAGNLRAWRHP